MGWSGGTELMEKMINIAMRYIPNQVEREGFFRAAITAFEQHDWDCQTEVMGIDPAFDIALHDKHPDWEWNNTFDGFDGSEE
jgi:hypothetical protein